MRVLFRPLTRILAVFALSLAGLVATGTAAHAGERPTSVSPNDTCVWFQIASGAWTGGPAFDPKSLRETITVKAMHSISTGRYCGSVMTTVCGTALDDSYINGMVVWNIWYSDGMPVGNAHKFFATIKGGTICINSPTYGAAHSASAVGQWTTGTGDNAGQHQAGAQV